MLSPHFIPLGAFAMVVLIVAIASMRKMREKELEAHQQLRRQEMEHERKMRSWRLRKPSWRSKRRAQRKAARTRRGPD